MSSFATMLIRRAFTTTPSTMAAPKKGLPKLLLLVPAITFGLGTWQVFRKKKKEELIEFMNAKLTKPAVPLPQDVIAVSGMEYERVEIEGEFIHDQEMIATPRTILREAFDGNMGEDNIGAQIITPFRRKDNGHIILVNRGFVPQQMVNPDSRQQGQLLGLQKVIGIVRLGETQTSFVPDNRPDKNMWHWIDVIGMAKERNADPILIDVVAECTPENGLPLGGQSIVQIRNEHMQYIMTWYSLTLATIALWIMAKKKPSLGRIHGGRRLPPKLAK
eukprot:m.7762 g.7762  ORF g.7762 m.7762 type:complete len:275 (+) comp2909_c0_seq1:166-990(+)